MAVDEKKADTIYVNTEPFELPHGALKFEQIVKLAYPSLVTEEEKYLFKISYRLGRGHSDLKTLGYGESVEVQEGMIFNVSYENRS